MTKSYSPKLKNQFFYFLRPFVLVLFIMNTIYNGIIIGIEGPIKTYYPLITALSSILIGLYKTYQISYRLDMDGSFIKISNIFSKKVLLDIDTEDYFIQANFDLVKYLRAYNFQKIGSDDRAIKVNLAASLDAREYEDVLAKLSAARRGKLTQQLGLDKEESYLIKNSTGYKISDSWALLSSLVLPLIIIVLNMLFKNKLEYSSLKGLIIILFLVFFLKGIRELMTKRNRKVRELMINKKEISLRTRNCVDTFKWRNVKEIILTHPSVVNLESKMIQIYDGEKHYLYYLGDSREASREYAIIYGLVYLHSRHKIGMFY